MMTAVATRTAVARRRLRRANLLLAAWLRHNSEYYLLEAAQVRSARQVGRLPPAGASGPAAMFWRHVFVPAYRQLPWPVRRRIMAQLPGSHRRVWHPPPVRRSPAV
jgi:hypothetical protein